jgi:hypothetical protein
MKTHEAPKQDLTNNTIIINGQTYILNLVDDSGGVELLQDIEPLLNIAIVKSEKSISDRLVWSADYAFIKKENRPASLIKARY